uniref:Uncharacterized protein n=1 Tax=viral metagenome TaxID=1070528 RepID=A0A6C0LU90_9ZZZZ|tara:strand:+ start:673 stop:1263 length:591 start_codon:yes stop_codon:yes gene_type:complete
MVDYVIDILTRLLYLCVCAYSEMEYMYNVYVKPHLPVMNNIESYEIIQNGMICDTMTDINTIDFIRHTKQIDFIRHTKQIDTIVYGSITRHMNKIRCINPVYNRFMSIELVFLDETYEIKLSKTINYYIDGNELLFIGFIQLYMNTTYGVIIDLNDTYSITLVDMNVNVVEMDQNDSLILTKNSYKIIKNTDIDSE